MTLHRPKEHALLASLLQPGIPLPPILLLQGPTHSGKKLVLRRVLEERLEVDEERVQLVSGRVSLRPLLVSSAPTFFLNDVADALGVSEEDVDDRGKMATVDDLVQALRRKYAASAHSVQMVLELLHVDELLESGRHGSLLASLTRLQEWSRLNLCLVLVSSSVNIGLDRSKCVTVAFEAYSRSELVDLLAHALGEQEENEPSPELAMSQTLLRAYAEAIIGLYMATTNSLPRLLAIALHLKALFIAPLLNDECDYSATHFLCKRFCNELKDRSLDEIMATKSGIRTSDSLDAVQVATDSSTKMSRMHVELPYFSKLLLIAAFLASYNPPRTDTKMFVKNSKVTGRKSIKKSAKNDQATKKTSAIHAGPKPFPLERLMAIFYAIQTGAVHPSLQIQCQLASLLKLGFMTQQGTSSLDAPTFKANVCYEFVLHLSKNVEVDLPAYLYDSM